MTNLLAQDLGGVVRLLEKATPGVWNHYESKYDGDVYMVQAAPPKMHVLCRYNGDGDGYTQQDVDNAAAIAACVNFLRTHSAEIAGALRDAERWRSMDEAPPHNRKNHSMGTEYMIWPPTSSGERTAFFGRRLGGKATWYKYGAPVHGVTHWRPLPAPPTQDSAMQQGGAG